MSDLKKTFSLMMKILKETNAYAVGFDFVILYHRQSFEIRVTKKVNGELVTYVNIIPIASVVLSTFDHEDYFIAKANKFFELKESQTIKRKDGIYEDFIPLKDHIDGRKANGR